MPGNAARLELHLHVPGNLTCTTSATCRSTPVAASRWRRIARHHCYQVFRPQPLNHSTVQPSDDLTAKIVHQPNDQRYSPLAHRNPQLIVTLTPLFALLVHPAILTPDCTTIHGSIRGFLQQPLKSSYSVHHVYRVVRVLLAHVQLIWIHRAKLHALLHRPLCWVSITSANTSTTGPPVIIPAFS